MCSSCHTESKDHSTATVAVAQERLSNQVNMDLLGNCSNSSISDQCATNWNITLSERTAVSDMDNQSTLVKSHQATAATMAIRSSESVQCTFSTNLDHSDRRLRLKKDASTLLRIAFLTTVVMFLVLDLSSSGLSSIGAEAAPVKGNNTDQKNIWQDPCGGGRYQATAVDSKKVETTKKKNYIKDVFMHTRQMINSLQQQGQDSHWVDGEWEHTLPDDFEFPDISHFTFRKAHSALQQYMAIFQKFAVLEEDRRQELKATFEKMKTDTRALLCLIESVINGTNAVANGPGGRRHRGGAALQNVRRPAYRYYSRHVMERKLRRLTEVLNEETILPIAKVVFQKYLNFVKVVSKKTNLRLARNKQRNVNGDAMMGAVNKVNGGESVQERKEAAVAETKKPLHQRKNKGNKNHQKNPNNNNNNNKNKLNKGPKKNRKSNQIGVGARRNTGMGGRRKDRQD